MSSTNQPATDERAPRLRNARAYACRLLRYRPRSTTELSERLTRRGVPAAVIHHVMTELAAAGQVDDRQFAKLWAQSRLRNHIGLRRIADELSQRGIARPLVTETLDTLRHEYDERAAAHAFVERRLARCRRTPRSAQWRRLFGQLARRGFPIDVIEETLHQVLVKGQG